MNITEQTYSCRLALVLLFGSLFLCSCNALRSSNSDEDNLSVLKAETNLSPTLVRDISSEYEILNTSFEEEPPSLEPIADETDILSVSIVDIWPRVRVGFQLALSADNQRIAQQRAWYKKHQRYMDRVLTRADPFLHYIVTEIEKRNMPMEFALLPIVESAYDPFAYSHGRAAGMWQFIPGTGKAYGLKQNWWYDGRRDVVESTQAALDYLNALQKQFNGDWLLALAAYNSGSGTVRKAIRRNKRAGKPVDYWSLKLPKETQAYVPKLIALAQIVKEPKHHDITLKSIPNEPTFEIVPIGAQLDLAKAASMAKLEITDLYRLNPGFNRWATDPDGPHRLIIPLNQVALFTQNLQALPPEQRVKWTRYKIKSGDSLIKIAKKFNTSPKQLKHINRIKGHTIRAGKTLLIPQASHSMATYSLSNTQRTIAKQSTAPKGKTKKQHTVRRGESFWTIAQKYRVPVRQLAQWNGLATRDLLQIGQQLVVWVDSSTSGMASSNGTAHSPTDPQTIRRLNYNVRSGDSLSRIANKFNVSVVQIEKWNRLNIKRYLQPGQKLTLFVDVRNL